jgi:hypothetical protein
MVKRMLPELRNPLVAPENSPKSTCTFRVANNRVVVSLTCAADEILVERRRLGQTILTVKQGTVGVANASKAENMGTFDYAHLRVPLPKDLSGSGVFTFKTATAYPESYFLMV